MPANMMKAETGGRPTVRGIRIATVVAGPIPGRTPIAVPRVTPMIDQMMLSGVSATANPWASNASVSITWLPSLVALEHRFQRPERQIDPKAKSEDQQNHGGEDEAYDRVR